jgi:glyoxylase-like metal-dependent hydrolase (beta-lactamase superfamily II)
VARVPAIVLAPGVVRIPTTGAASINSFALVDDDGSVTLVDCGLKRAPAKIVAGLRAIGRHPCDVTRIVLTHAHTDHAGGAAEMVARTGAPVAVHEADAAYVEAGHHPPYDPSLLVGRLITRIPGGGFPPVPVGERLADGQLLDVGGGLRIVATPGHTPGHVSLLHEPTATLITGDALFNMRHLRFSSQHAAPALLVAPALYGLPAQRTDSARAGRARVRPRGLHPRHRDPRGGPGGGPRVPRRGRARCLNRR